MERVQIMAVNNLHSYLNPPVVETLLGLQFEPLPEFKNVHLGVFWATLGPEWAKVSDAPASPPELERFGEDQMLGPFGAMKFGMFQVFGAPPMRIRMESIDGDRAVQIQNGRIFFNWVKGKTGSYPQYDSLKPAFRELFDKFCQFVKDWKLGELVLNQWEVTYVNHLPKGTVWNSPADWSALFSPIAQLSPDSEFLELESFGGERHYIIPPNKGRLHVQLRHTRTDTGPTGTEVIILKLTARGPITPEENRSPTAFDSGLNLGHDVVRKSFERLTSEGARNHWKGHP